MFNKLISAEEIREALSRERWERWDAVRESVEVAQKSARSAGEARIWEALLGHLDEVVRAALDPQNDWKV